MASGQVRTAADLRERQKTGKTPREVLREHVRRKLASLRSEGLDQEGAIQRLYPNTILDPATLRSFTTAILAGNHTLLFGPPGSGKTNLAKDVWDMFPKSVWAVDGCPVHDDPFSVIDPVFARSAPPCPFCKENYWTEPGAASDGKDPGGGRGLFRRGKKSGDGEPGISGWLERSMDSVDPETVPVAKVTLREGYGFARVQGSPEVFPDNLTGTINIHKLEEIGDPTSPLILEPGKLLQANRGLLIIDEIGKLPLGTQNVLLQALQESTVSPAKSRETFPASFLAVATSNLDDLDNINEPLNDRLTNLHVGFNEDHERNRLIIELALARHDSGVFVPAMFLDASAYLTESWRRSAGRIHEFAEVGSNRTMIDIVTRACAHASLAGQGTLGLDAFRRGVRDAMMGRIRVRGGDSFAHNRAAVAKFIDNHLEPELARAGMLYWCTYFRDELKGNRATAGKVVAGMKEFSAAAAKAGKKPDAAAAEYGRLSESRWFSSFAGYVLKRERGSRGVEDWRAVLTSFSLLEQLDVFECPKSGVDL